ncbi:MAG: hypothetical protein QW128_01110 [Thermoprotei archaeon]
MDGINRVIRDKEYLEWNKIYYHVVGYEHPPGYALAFPKYAPTDKKTPWYNGTTYYERLIPHYGAEGIDASISKIKEKIKSLTRWDNVFGANVPLIPLDQVKTIYIPETRLSILEGRDTLERLALELVDILSSYSNIPKNFFGVTGTLLIGIHNEQISDIDLTISGKNLTEKIKDTLNSILEDRSKGFSRYSIKNIINDASHHGLYSTNIYQLFNRIWHKGFFKKKPFSISPIKTEQETTNTYGKYIYRSLGPIELTAIINKPIDPFFSPIRYELCNVSILSGLQLTVNELVSYDSFYLDLLKVGDRIYVKGLLQEVFDTLNKAKTFRVAIGVREVKTLLKIEQNHQ